MPSLLLLWEAHTYCFDLQNKAEGLKKVSVLCKKVKKVSRELYRSFEELLEKYLDGLKRVYRRFAEGL